MLDALLARIADPAVVQRDKLAAVRDRLADLPGLDDAGRGRLVHELRRRINSKKLIGELTELIEAITGGRPLPPPPAPSPPPPPPPAPMPPPPTAPTYTLRPLPPAAAELEAAIAAAPDVRDSYIVYGDLLEAHGDPRGQLIAIGHQINKNPHHRAMLATFREYLAEHDAALRGPLASCDDLVGEVEWFMGFIKKCRVENTSERSERRAPRVAIPDVIGYLLDDPAPARFLQHLTIGIVDFEDNHYVDVCRVIARRPRPALRTLYLGDFASEETELNWSSIGDIGFLWPAVPNLTELVLRSGRMTLGTIALPALRRLKTITGGLDATALTAIANAEWPALVELSLQIGRRREGAATDVALVAPFLTGARTPQLTALGITNCEFTDELCARLPDAPILPQLRELDLSMGTMTDAGAAFLIANQTRFAHLDRLIVEDNYLSEHTCRALDGCARQVAWGGQRLDEGGPYYASAFE